MGSMERTQRICDNLQLGGWKRKIVGRALNGCGNCNLRYACISKILDGADFNVALLRQALNIITSQTKPTAAEQDVTWLAREVARIGRNQCHSCNALGLCLSNAHYAAWANPLDMKIVSKQVKRVQANMNAADWERRIQDVLDLSGVGNTALIKRALYCFANCKQRPVLEEIPDGP